jgi:RNA polymerase sigma factor (sigma-70 family)
LHTKPDEDLVAAGRRGDTTAYADLVRRHLRRIFAICLALLGNRADAEDATQEAFVKGLQRIDTLRDHGQFPAWLGQIARNHCRDVLRGRARRRDLPLTDALAASLPASGEPQADDEFADLRAALARLPEDLSLPLLLFYDEGRSTQRLAEILGLTQGGVCARLYRARRELRRLLEEEDRHGA